MGVYDLNGNLLDGLAPIKPYYSEEMADTIAKIRALQTEPNLTFFVVTDIHSYFVSGAETLYKTSVVNMRNLLKEIPCDGVINLGDSIEGYPSDTTAMEYGNLVSNEFRKIGIPYYSVIGNHDDNRYHNSTNNDRLTVAERYQVFVNPTRIVTADATGLNWYIDYPEFKLRMIALNSVSDYTYKYSDDTCTWFSSVLGSVPAGYEVLLLVHTAPVGAWNYNDTTPTNSSTIATALTNFSGAKFVLCGHNHVDNTYTTPWPGITLCCEKFENSSVPVNPLWPEGAVKPLRTLGTATEDLWTIAVYRPNAGKVNFVRFGAGSDYELTI